MGSYRLVRVDRFTERTDQVLPELPRRRVALVALPRHRPPDGARERRGDVGPDVAHVANVAHRPRRRHRTVRKVVVQQHRIVLSPGRGACQELEQHHARGVDVGACVHAMGRRRVGLLRGHVLGRSDDMREALGLHPPGDAEVPEEHPLGRCGPARSTQRLLCLRGHGAEQDVRRLHVPVDDPAGVHRGQTAGELDAERRDLGDGERRAGLLREAHPVLEAAAVGELHHHVRTPVGELCELVQPHDAVAVEAAQGAGLLDEPPARVLALAPVVREDLQRDQVLEVLVVRQPHGRERSAAERALQPVPADPAIERHRTIMPAPRGSWGRSRKERRLKAPTSASDTKREDP